MRSLKFVNWQQGDFWYGYWLDYPDYWTQGTSIEDLKAHLVDLLADIESGEIPGIRRVEELILP